MNRKKSLFHTEEIQWLPRKETGDLDMEQHAIG